MCREDYKNAFKIVTAGSRSRAIKIFDAFLQTSLHICYFKCNIPKTLKKCKNVNSKYI